MMWYASSMAKFQTHQSMIENAEAAVKHAQEIRAYHRKRSKPGDKQRDVDIRHALTKVRAAMRPIRSQLGRAPYDNSADAAERRVELRAISEKLQAERRKLWKLRGGKRS